LSEAPVPDVCPKRDGLKRWLWFIGLWAAGVGVTALVSLVIKLWLR
jgi:hypothetical protein